MKDRQLVLKDGRILSFAEYGAEDGAPVFGFHGTPGSRFMFKIADVPAKRRGIRLIAPERPGFGRSTFQKGWSLAQCAADISALADSLDLRHFALAGISGGGPFAAACAALLPERVTVAALVSPLGPLRAPYAPNDIADRMIFRLLPKAVPLLSVSLMLARHLFLYRPSFLYRLIKRRAALSDRAILERPDVRRNLLEGIAEGLRPGIGGAIQEMQILVSPWLVPLNAIRAPTILWQGMEDRNVPVKAALHLAGLIPNCRLIKLKGAGHYWMFDNIDEVLLAIKNATKEM